MKITLAFIGGATALLVSQKLGKWVDSLPKSNEAWARKLVKTAANLDPNLSVCLNMEISGETKVRGKHSILMNSIFQPFDLPKMYDIREDFQ